MTFQQQARFAGDVARRKTRDVKISRWDRLNVNGGGGGGFLLSFAFCLLPFQSGSERRVIFDQ